MQVSDIHFGSEFEIKGIWWLPEDQNDKKNGKLSYSIQNGIKLEVSGNFKLTRNQQNSSNEYSRSYRKVIYGRLISGLTVSLFKCTREGYSGMCGECIYQKFNVSTAFFGKHLEEENTSQLNFTRMDLTLTHLEDWLGTRNAISINNDGPQLNNENDHLTITYKRPSLPSFTIKCIESEVEFLSQSKSISKGWHHSGLVHRCSINITPFIEKSFDWFSQIALDIENFLSLLSDTQSQYTQLLLYTNRSFDEPVTVLHKLMNPIYEKETLHPLEMIIPFQKISTNFKNILELWFKKTNELRPVFDLFFSVRNNQRLYVQSKFLHLTQAIEIFHRKEEPSTYLEEIKFNNFKESIVESIEIWPTEDGFKESFLNRLKYANEFSLRTRLRKVILSLNSKLSNEFFKDRNKFINEIIGHRNNLTHYGPSRKDRSEKKLYYYNIKLSILLSYLILTTINIPSNLVSERLIEKRKYYFN